MVPTTRRVAVTLTSLGNAYLKLGEDQQAIKLQQQALAIEESVFGPDHPQVAVTLTSLGNAYLKLGEDQQVIKLQQRALTINETMLGPDDPKAVVVRRLLDSA